MISGPTKPKLAPFKAQILSDFHLLHSTLLGSGMVDPFFGIVKLVSLNVARERTRAVQLTQGQLDHFSEFLVGRSPFGAAALSGIR